MSTGLLPIIKKAAIDAVDNSQMCDLRYGTVTSISPLKVQITNQFVIPQSLLVVPEHLTNRKISVTLNLESETAGTHTHNYSGATTTDENHSHNFDGETKSGGSHSHTINGTHTITINNALKVGDRVALLRKQGGQSYFILDRI